MIIKVSFNSQNIQIRLPKYVKFIEGLKSFGCVAIHVSKWDIRTVWYLLFLSTLNTIKTVFFICIRKYCPKSKYQLSLQGQFNDEDNIPGTDPKNSYYCIYCSDFLKITEEKSSCLNSREIRIEKCWRWEKRRHYAMVSFCNALTFSISISKVTIFFDKGLYRQISFRCQVHLTQWKYSISFMNKMATGK